MINYNFQVYEEDRKKFNTYYDADFVVKPKFPESMNIELVNVCNHSCNFCAYQFMNRKSKKINLSLLKKLLKEAQSLGTKEVGLHSGTEPLASKDLEHIIEYCKNIGIEYTYFSTNGTLANEERVKKIIKSGIDSIKFSINAGNKELYHKIHGKDHFDRAIRTLKEFHKNKINSKPYLAVSFVRTEENKHSENTLKEITKHYIDEFVPIIQHNQSGQMITKNENFKLKKCGIPFKKITITSEGYLRVCCNDYDNYLAVIDLKKTNLKDAYYSKEMNDFRLRHINNQLEGLYVLIAYTIKR